MKLFHSEEGSVLVEVALIAPVIIVMILGVVNFGFMLQQDLAVADSARAGAAYALTWGNQTRTSQMAAVATVAAGSIPSYQAAATNFCTCGPGGTAISCTSSCSSYGQPTMYAQVTATATLPVLLGTGTGIPVSSVARVRISCPSCY